MWLHFAEIDDYDDDDDGDGNDDGGDDDDDDGDCENYFHLPFPQ